MIVTLLISLPYFSKHQIKAKQLKIKIPKHSVKVQRKKVHKKKNPYHVCFKRVCWKINFFCYGGDECDLSNIKYDYQKSMLSIR